MTLYKHVIYPMIRTSKLNAACSIPNKHIRLCASLQGLPRRETIPELIPAKPARSDPMPQMTASPINPIPLLLALSLQCLGFVRTSLCRGPYRHPLCRAEIPRWTDHRETACPGSGCAANQGLCRTSPVGLLDRGRTPAYQVIQRTPGCRTRRLRPRIESLAVPQR